MQGKSNFNEMGRFKRWLRFAWFMQQRRTDISCQVGHVQFQSSEQVWGVLLRSWAACSEEVHKEVSENLFPLNALSAFLHLNHSVRTHSFPLIKAYTWNRDALLNLPESSSE